MVLLVDDCSSSPFALGPPVFDSDRRCCHREAEFEAQRRTFGLENRSSGAQSLFPNDKMQRVEVVRARPSRPQAKVDQLGRF
jgi:hypothetical protein